MSIYVESPDTDVFILLIGHYSSFNERPKVWFQTGVITRLQDLRRFIPIHIIFDTLGETLSNILPNIHCLSGCDTVSQFSGFGKKKVYNAAKKCCEEILLNLKTISDDNVSIETKVDAGRKFVALLYDNKSVHAEQHSSLNDLHSRLSHKKSSTEQLPPSEAAFLQHIKRSSWQAHIWANAINSTIKHMNPIENGWQVRGKKLIPIYFEGPTSMDILDKYICGCGGKRSCERSTCPCRAHNLECCDACSCSNCQNKTKIQEVDIHELDVDDSLEYLHVV